MTDTRARDFRRWDSYERLASDASASESERAQARSRIEELRARYPEGRPKWTERRNYGGWAHQYDAAPDEWARWAEREREREAERERRRAREERMRHTQAVRAQRIEVERVPNWQTCPQLRELHDCRSEWSSDEYDLFKQIRVRLTGSSRAVDL